MNRILREEMEYLITCDDKSITPDVKDDVKMTLDYIDELEQRINKVIEYCEDITSRAIDISDTDYDLGQDFTARDILTILRGEDTPKEDLINHLVNDCGCVIEDTPKENKKYIEHIKMQENILHNDLNIIDKINEIIDRLNGKDNE